MFTETLPKNTKKALELLSRADIVKEAYLAGGTACALQLGHRISDDLDFFINILLYSHSNLYIILISLI